MQGNILGHACVLVALGIGMPALAAAQTAPLASRDVPLSVDSGYVENAGTQPAIVFSTRIDVPDAPWIRLRFDDVLLAGSPQAGDGSYLLITSASDGAVQQLNAKSVSEWQYTSAYFNGGTVTVELVAHPGTGASRVALSRVIAGAGITEGTRSICGPTDDRVLSNDPRVGRIMPVGCTGWIIDDCHHCLLTAGHCDGALSVVEFNVPLSGSNGTLNHPGPQDQYSVDPASIQSNGGPAMGDDWAYFGCFPNSNTGLTPYEAQQGAFTLVNPPPATGQPVRVTGYGTVSAPVSPTWNQVQKTHVGPLVAAYGTLVLHQVDTTGGNSGSPIFLEDTALAIGIHTNAGCTSTGGQNGGTSAAHAGLQSAIASPRGVCAGPTLKFTFPNGRPPTIASSGGTGLRVDVSPQSGLQPQAHTGQLHYNTGSGFVTVDLTEISPNQYEGLFPAVPCGTQVRYYVSALATTGVRYYSGTGCNRPYQGYVTNSAISATTVAAYDFETTTGWTVENVNLTDGAWVAGVPVGDGSRGDPTQDYDGSGRCFLTGNVAGNSDVDGGPTRLISPRFDLSAIADPTLAYARWFSCSNNDADRLEVEISHDDGQTWTMIESVANTPGWVYRQVRVDDYIGPTQTVRVRFSATDNPDDSTTEAAVDAFSIRRLICTSDLLGDLNCDGVVSNLDIDHFVQALFNPAGYVADHDGNPYPVCSIFNGDFTGDGAIDNLDIDGFVAVLFPK